MKSLERPVVLPGFQAAKSRWSVVWLCCSASAIGTGAMAAMGTCMGKAPLPVGLVMAPILIGLGVMGLLRSMRRWTRGLSAPELLVHLRNEQSLVVYRVFMPISLALLVIGIVLSLGSTDHPSGLVMSGTMFCCLWGGLEWFRRRARRRAHILFTLYADGVLEPEEAAAIDAERRHSPSFDAAVLGFQRWNAAIAELSRVESAD